MLSILLDLVLAVTWSTAQLVPNRMDQSLNGERPDLVVVNDNNLTLFSQAKLSPQTGICREAAKSSGVVCDASASGDLFRRIDGVCNNLEVDKLFGSASIAMRRLASPAYADGVSSPRTAPNLPNPKVVSDELHRATPSSNNAGSQSTRDLSHMAMQFGQFLDHDLTITPERGACNSL